MTVRIGISGWTYPPWRGEFYPRGLTAVDDLEELTLGTRPTLSHATAQLEVQQLVTSLLGTPAERADIANAA